MLISRNFFCSHGNPGKSYFLTILLLSISLASCFAQQSKFPEGVYLNIEQLKNYSPAFQADLIVTKRSEEDINNHKGNDYIIEPNPNAPAISRKTIRNKIFAYVKQDSIFLNAAQFDIRTGYALALTCGNNLVFKGCLPKEDSEIMGIQESVRWVKAADTTEPVRWVKASPQDRLLFVLCIRPYSIRELTQNNMLIRLKENQYLLDEFNAEEDQSSEHILIYYMDLLNRVTE